MTWKNRSCLVFLAALISSAIGGVSPLQAEEARPAPGAELLMARYWAGGMVAPAGVPDMPSKSLDFALFSDGTVLLRSGTYDIAALPSFRAGMISAEIVRARHAIYLEPFKAMKASYGANCWIEMPDGSRRAAGCVSDASQASIVIKDEPADRYITVSVDAAGYWREMPDILDFIPPTYFEAMSWMDGLSALPSEKWSARHLLVAAEKAGPILPAVKFVWPREWPALRGDGQAVCLSFDLLSRADRASLPGKLGTSYVNVASTRLSVKMLDAAIPHLDEIDYFRDLGVNTSCQ